jgi:hypothetical protein
MNWYRRNWYTVGLFIGAAAVVLVAVEWQRWELLQRLLLLNFAALLFHQFEEYGWPGGEPAIMNRVIQPSANPDRYPLNQNSAMVINVFVAYPFYLVPVFFPNLIWLGLAPVLFGMMQIVMHGILTNVKLKTLYNPGLLAVALGHIPIGVYYIYIIESRNLATVWDWVFGVAYLMAFVGIAMRKLTYSWLADRDSPYPFDRVEMARFNVEARMARNADK